MSFADYYKLNVDELLLGAGVSDDDFRARYQAEGVGRGYLPAIHGPGTQGCSVEGARAIQGAGGNACAERVCEAQA